MEQKKSPIIRRTRPAPLNSIKPLPIQTTSTKQENIPNIKTANPSRATSFKNSLEELLPRCEIEIPSSHFIGNNRLTSRETINLKKGSCSIQEFDLSNNLPRQPITPVVPYLDEYTSPKKCTESQKKTKKSSPMKLPSSRKTPKSKRSTSRVNTNRGAPSYQSIEYLPSPENKLAETIAQIEHNEK